MSFARILNASLGELRAIAHAICENMPVSFQNTLEKYLQDKIHANSDGPQDTDHASLIEQATAHDLKIALFYLCNDERIQKKIANYLQVLRHTKSTEIVEAAKPLDPIKNASAKVFHRIILALCVSEEIKKRVSTHLCVLRLNMPDAAIIAGSDPCAIISAATETELHAIGLAMCEGDENIKKQVLECMRVLRIFGQLLRT